MTSDLRYPDSRLRVCVQNFADKVLALWGEELWHGVICAHDLLIEIGCLWVLEGQVSSHHGIEDNTTTPNVSLQSVVLLASNHLSKHHNWSIYSSK